MFGMENQKKTAKAPEFLFDLEQELKDQKKMKELKSKLDISVQKIKSALRTGGEKKDMDNLGLLLNGYTSLLKVMSRVGAVKK